MNHPAKFGDDILLEIGGLLLLHGFEGKILDPFAGTGRIHELPYDTIGVEIEPEWAEMQPNTIVGDATRLPFAANTFDAVITSPCYGNRMADNHNAKDDSKRITYKHVLGRDLSPDSAGQLQWGRAYRELHQFAWTDTRRVLKPTGLFILNISNHIRKYTEVDVTKWHLEQIVQMNFSLVDTMKVETPRMGFGANRERRVEYESILVFRKGE